MDTGMTPLQERQILILCVLNPSCRLSLHKLRHLIKDENQLLKKCKKSYGKIGGMQGDIYVPS